MSEQEPPNYQLNYVTTSPYGSAPMLVKLAGIFNLVMGGIFALAALYYIGSGIFLYLLMTGKIGRGMPPPTSGPFLAGMRPEMVIMIMNGVFAVVDSAAAVLQISGGISILKRSPRAFALAIAAIASGFLAGFSCSIMCFLPLGSAIYTLVVICMENPRCYLRNQPPAGSQTPAA